MIDMLAGPTDDAILCFPTRVVGPPAAERVHLHDVSGARPSDEQFESQHASLLREFENIEREFA